MSEPTRNGIMMNGQAKIWRSLGSGLIGASALTLLHETARRAIPDAPRMDLIAMRAVEKPLRRAGVKPPRPDRLHAWVLVGDVLSNGLYYSLVGGGSGRTWRRGLALGLAAGVGGALLPPLLGLEKRSEQWRPDTAVMTVAWYLVGGLVAAGAARLLGRAGQPGEEDAMGEAGGTTA